MRSDKALNLPCKTTRRFVHSLRASVHKALLRFAGKSTWRYAKRLMNPNRILLAIFLFLPRTLFAEDALQAKEWFSFSDEGERLYISLPIVDGQTDFLVERARRENGATPSYSIRLQNYLPNDSEGLAAGEFFLEVIEVEAYEADTFTEMCSGEIRVLKNANNGIACAQDLSLNQAESSITHIGLVRSTQGTYIISMDGSQLHSKDVERIFDSIRVP